MELPSDLLQRPRPAVVQSEPETDHLALPLGQRTQNLIELLSEQRVGGRLGGHLNILVLNESAEMTVLLLADRRLEGNRLLRDLLDLTDFLHRNIHLLRDFLRRGLPAKLLKQLALYADQPVDCLHHMNRDPDRPRLIGDRPRDGLADP